MTDSQTPKSRGSRRTPERKLREALAAYKLDLPALRRLVASGGISHMLNTTQVLPDEIDALLSLLTTLLTPAPREQIKSPTDVAALLMVDMARLDQEELRIICLDTKNRVQHIDTLYRGSLNSSMVRIGEVFKSAIRLNSAAIIVSHNHPSGDPTPSPEDVLVTRQIIDAGRLLDIDVLDHLVIGQGRFVSMRERGLGFR